MAFPTSVNDQVTDSVTQSDVSVVACAPATAMGNLYQSTAHAIALSMQNAVASQQQTNTVASTAVASGVASLLGEKKSSK
jgi:hypothetical protein